MTARCSSPCRRADLGGMRRARDIMGMWPFLADRMAQGHGPASLEYMGLEHMGLEHMGLEHMSLEHMWLGAHGAAGRGPATHIRWWRGRCSPAISSTP